MRKVMFTQADELRSTMHQSPTPPFILLSFVLPMSANAQSVEWAHAVGNAQQEIAYAVAVDREGAVITVGTFSNTADLDPGVGESNVTSNGSSDVFIQKLDSAGVFVWGRALGANGADLGLGVSTDMENNIVVCGKVSGTVDLDPGPDTYLVTPPNTSSDAFVIKLDAAGDFIWGRHFGGNSNDQANDVVIDAQGDIITVGVLGSSGDLDPGSETFDAGGNGQQDIFVQKMDADGDFIWGMGLGGSANDMAQGVAIGLDGSVRVTGEFRTTVDMDSGADIANISSNGSEDIFVLALDAEGDLQWVHGLGGTGSERGMAIAVGPDGGAVVTGRITSTTDMDPGPDVANLMGSNFEDAFLLKLDATGAYQWAFRLAAFLNEGLDLAVDMQNNVFASGSFGTSGSNALDIDPGPGISPLLSNGASDAFLVSYTGNGALRWGLGVGGAQNDIGHAVAVSTRGRIALAGEFRQTMDVEPGPGIQLLSSVGGQDAFTILYDKPDCAGVFVRIQALLSGAHVEGEAFMSDAIRSGGLLPLEEPYTAMGFGLEESATTTPAVLFWTQASAIVDWVMVELRDAQDPAQVVVRRAGLLQRDGDVVSVDGVSPIGFCTVQGNYHVALRHRNHLGLMTAEPIALSAVPITLDLRDPNTAVFGTDAGELVDGQREMWPGNVWPDTVLRYTGEDNDRDPILTIIGGVVPTASAVGYLPEDVNMDGIVLYTGANNDRDRLLQAIGGVVPTEIRSEQLP
ncbi:MAG: hypothetical protein IPJ10_15850 [Flavobacteriales bacterium]|nr:hypothetical protein [Flavobacteriales bacterium]